jgi:hypothetical protein
MTVDILDTDAMNKEIQMVTEQLFGLSMSAPIKTSSLRSRLGFLSNTDFATSLLAGEVHIPWEVDDVTAKILGEVICLFQLLKEGHSVVTLGNKQLQY